MLIVTLGLAFTGKWALTFFRKSHDRALSLDAATRAQGFDRFYIKYTVRDGDTLWKLARYFYGSGSTANQQRLRDANPDIPEDPRQLKIGHQLKIPVI